MTRSAWRNLLLAVAVAVSAVFVYLKPGREASVLHPLASMKPDAARSIRIERGGAPVVVLERRDEDWFVREPFAARADPSRVQRLLAVAGAQPTARLPATDLARFELDRPVVRLLIDGQALAFGMVNPVSHEQYLLTGEAVYTIPGDHASALPRNAADVLDKQLLSRSEVPESIELASFRVFREEGRWVVAPAAGELSQDDIQRWTDDWRHASALRVEPAPQRAPTGVIRMRFRDGSALSLGILAREPELALLRPDEKLVYYLFRGTAQRLLAPPQAPREAGHAVK